MQNSAFLATRDGSMQTVTSSTIVDLDFTVKQFDLRNDYDLSTDQFVAPFDGIYSFNASVRCNDAVEYCNAYINVNGSTLVSSNTNLGADNYSANANIILALNEGDTVEAGVNNGGGTQVRGETHATYFSGASITDFEVATSSPYIIDVGSSIMLGGILSFLVAYWVVGLARNKTKS